jgi:alpha-1,6-mannosyltransferase
MWRVGEVCAAIAREQPHVVEINSPYLAAWAVRKLRSDFVGIKTFWYHADFIDTYIRPFLESSWPMRIANSRAPAAVDFLVEPFWSMVRSIARPCAAVFSASRYQADKLRSHGIENVIVLPFGIDKGTFRSEGYDPCFRTSAASAAGQGGDTPILLAMGRFAVEKRWDVLLDAFVRFRSRNPGLLVAFGDGPERPKLEKQMAGRRDVIFMGFEKDKKKLAAALASADLFVHACPFETFGLSVAQATACGVPLVVPDQGGAAELADDTFAERYPAGDAAACAAAIERILARDTQSLRISARRAGAAVPDVRDQMLRTVDVYRELLRKSGKEVTGNACSRLSA